MVSAVIVSAGSGKRMKSSKAKQFIELGGKPICAFAVEAFQKCKVIDEIIIVTGKNDIDYFQKEIVERYNFSKVKSIVSGGTERQYSVYNGLKAVSDSCEIVHIHDGVRPFVRTEDIENITEKAREFGCCVLGVKAKDTVKICREDIVTDTPDRESLWLAQTPQTFRYNIITEAHKKAEKEGFLGTDDAMLAERYSNKIKMVSGSYDNIKITTPEDLYFARAIIQQREEL